MLGLLHKIVLGQAHAAFSQLFPVVGKPQHQYYTRLAARCHSKQILDRCHGPHPAYLGRSVFGMARIYNRLPQETVDIASVSRFQSSLTSQARKLCESGDESWQTVFKPPGRLGAGPEPVIEP
jgi:hypothetical protein